MTRLFRAIALLALPLCTPALSQGQALTTSARAAAKPAVPLVRSSYEVTEFASVTDPLGIDIAPPGSIYGSDLYVGSAVFVAENVGPDLILRVDANGTVSPFATLLDEADPICLEFPPLGSPFGDLLYVTSNNRDFVQPFDCGGVIQVVDALGAWADFTTNSGCINCNFDAPGWKGLGEPAGLAFGAGGDFGWDLYVANSIDAPADLMKVDLGGATSEFLDDALQSCTYFSGYWPIDVAFAPGGPFGNDLWFLNQGTQPPGDLFSIDASQVVSPLVITFPSQPYSLEFASGVGDFGVDLYVATADVIYRVRPDGNYHVFATGFTGINIDCLEFSPDETALYVADYEADKIYRITRDDPDASL